MTEERTARLRAHCNNVYRYKRLLKTELTELEREFLERRLSEELSALEVQPDFFSPVSRTELTRYPSPSDLAPVIRSA